MCGLHSISRELALSLGGLVEARASSDCLAAGAGLAWLGVQKNRESNVGGGMVSQNQTLARLIEMTIAFFCVALASPLNAAEGKITKEELVSRHVRSVGSEEALAGAGFRIARGTCVGRGRVFSQSGGESGELPGIIEFASGTETTQLSVKFESELYPVEGFHFDGKNIGLYAFQPPEASGLADTKFNAGQLTTNIPNFERYIKQGLFGGVLNTLWPFLNPQEVSKKQKSLKRKKINGKELLVQTFHLKGSRGVELFFDPETFHHVASRCRLEVIGTGSTSLADHKQRVTLREKFGDFAEFDGLQLPTSWTITLELPRDTSDWEIAFDTLVHTEDPKGRRSDKW